MNDEATMNVYEKLLQCRIELHSSPLKKSGWNDFSKYDYFELGDFLMPILNLFAKYKLFGKVSFTEDLATLDVINIEKPDESIRFTSPMGSANLKGCHVVQNIGAVETYQRRYLYVAAMEIVEHDALEQSRNEDTPENRIREAVNIKTLQEIFAEEYKAAKSAAEKKSVKKVYDERKDELTKVAGGAEGGGDGNGK